MRQQHGTATKIDRIGTGGMRRLRLAVAAGVLLTLAAGVLLAVLPAATAARGTTTASPTTRQAATMRETKSLKATLAGTATIVRDRLGIPARGLARDLSTAAEQSGELQEKATTVEEQLGVALQEMIAMRSTAADPHYLPALIAVGRAYAAASGRDPVGGFQLAPGYSGLASALTDTAAGQRAAAGQARKLARAARRVKRMLTRSSAKAGALERRTDNRG